MSYRPLIVHTNYSGVLNGYKMLLLVRMLGGNDSLHFDTKAIA